MAIKPDWARSVLSAKIRPRKSWLLLPNLLFLVIWCWGAAYIGATLIDAIENHGGAIARLSFGVILASAASLAWMYYFAQALFGYDSVEVGPSSLTVRSIVLGFVTSRKEFGNQLVRDLRYEEWPGGRAGQQSGIRFEYDSETFTFARQASAEDSWELIDQMCKVYKFSTPEPERSPAVVDWSESSGGAQP
jgi:hypothetical protein